MAITVIHKRDQTGGEHDLPHPQVYVGRPSPLGNPFVIGKDGTRDEVIALYRGWLDANLNHRSDEATAEAVTTEFNRIVHMLIANASIDLVCWCKPQACHGDVIKERLQLFLDDMDKYYARLDEQEVRADLGLINIVRDGDW